MKKIYPFIVPIVLFTVFIIFTILVKTVDVHYLYHDMYQANTYIGFYHANWSFGGFVSNLGKYDVMAKFSNIILYLSFAYVGVLFIFALIELIKKKSFKALNRRYYLLLGGYVAVVFVYLVFEIVKVNYAPKTSLDAPLKASYPSSHVFLGSMFFLLNSYTAIKLLKPEKEWISFAIYFATIIICLLEVFTRALSAKHWLTDIIASIILVSALFALFIVVSNKFVLKKQIEVKEE